MHPCAENHSPQLFFRVAIAQRPKLLAYRPKMAENIADALGLSKDQVSVKATTEEGLGFTGAGQGIAAQAIALLTAVGDRCYDSQIMSFCGAGCSGCCGADNEM